jgi:hypothetical protein
VAAEAFRDRLLDLLPIYSTTGRRLARLEPPDADDRTAAEGRWTDAGTAPADCSYGAGSARGAESKTGV